MPKLKIVQTRSAISRTKDQKDTLVGLGLGKIRKTIIRTDTPEIRGMVKKVIHMVSVEELD